MKTDVVGIGMPINKNDLKELLKETKETLAVEVKTEATTRAFGAIDLWNVQKKQRTSLAMMRRWAN
jgi:hypothetical protein